MNPVRYRNRPRPPCDRSGHPFPWTDPARTGTGAGLWRPLSPLRRAGSTKKRKCGCPFWIGISWPFWDLLLVVVPSEEPLMTPIRGTFLRGPFRDTLKRVGPVRPHAEDATMAIGSQVLHTAEEFGRRPDPGYPSEKEKDRHFTAARSRIARDVPFPMDAERTGRTASGGRAARSDRRCPQSGPLPAFRRSPSGRAGPAGVRFPDRRNPRPRRPCDLNDTRRQPASSTPGSRS